MNKYTPKDIEKKWQEKWHDDKIYAFDPSAKNKFYTLVELPYTSGDLHVGHWFNWATPDAYSRFKKLRGFNVFFPHGYDTIGLPAENAAIQRKIHPKDWTMKNVETMQAQFKTMGSMIDLDNIVITCSDDYFKWNQWIFIKMFERGIAYRGKALSNWCPKDKTVLADEHVEDGKCWRCGSVVEKKEVEQWFLKITKYADRLIWPEKPSVDWPVEVRVGQNQWIGKSEGMLLDFEGIEVFTTRPDTTDGATFIVLAPEHPKVKELTTAGQKNTVEEYVQKASTKSELQRKENKDKTGVSTGAEVLNPVSGKKIPVWVADYVLYGYGTGAIMAVPAADERDKEFAEKFGLPIEKTSFKAKPKGKKQVNYHIRDWSISRQRYWGTPVPMIHCEKCGIVPVPEKDLPVTLPYEVDFTPKGKPPLASNDEWLRVKCPKCGGNAQRDPETLDTFFDSAWYYYRYVSTDYDKAPFVKDRVKKMMPVDIYFGGAEHTLGHTLYARFFTKFFKDIGLVSFDEFALKRVQHGIVLGPDGNKMSKSKGNVINPDDVVKEYGADTVRLYLNFMMPYEGTAPWSTEAISGMFRFLQRIWKLQEKLSKQAKTDDESKARMSKVVRNITRDMEQIKNNTSIAFIMDWLNFLSQKKEISKEEYKTLLILLAPFAPHIAEELWQIIGEKYSVHQQKWPSVDEKALQKQKVNIPVQVNGKLRAVLNLSADNLKKDTVVKLALENEAVQKHLSGAKPEPIYVEGKVLNLVIKSSSK